MSDEIQVSEIRRRAAELGIDLSDELEKAIPALLDRLEESQREANSYLDDLRRVAADFDNFRKRTLRDQAHTVERAADRVVRGLLPVLDSFDAALAVTPSTDAERQLLDGMRRTHSQLLDALRAEGLEPIEALGMEFDPHLHEAVTAPTEDGTLIVTQELRRGYKIKDSVVRASLVGVDVEQE